MSGKFSAFEKHREALREVEMRKDVYTRQRNPIGATVKALTDLQQRRIEIMQEIADDYGVLAEKERLL